MVATFALIGQQFAALSVLEIVAVALAIAYLLLAIRQNIWCWLCAGVSTAIYVYLFVDAKLYMESALNGFYFLMAAYGWYSWRSSTVQSTDLPVSVWPMRVHTVAILLIAVLSGLSGFLLQRFTDAALPYVDSLTTFAAVWTTFLVARKVLENWWYWLVIDAASVAIYWTRGLELTALLFVLYLVMIPFGLLSWRRSFLAQKSIAVPA
jgi:nicotinamide mononucleotide transporter